MSLILVTAPATEPVTLTEAKAHCRVDYTDDDTLITSLIVAAREYCEEITRRAFITQTWDYKKDRFKGDEIDLPKGPLISVTSVKYIDNTGTEQTLATSEYDVRTYTSEQGEIGLAFSKFWPVVRAVDDAVTIRFVAGYGAASDVPQAIKQAMLMLIAHWYENRESVIAGITASNVPQAVDMLLAPHRVLEF